MYLLKKKKNSGYVVLPAILIDFVATCSIFTLKNLRFCGGKKNRNTHSFYSPAKVIAAEMLGVVWEMAAKIKIFS